MYEDETDGVVIRVEPEFLEEQSDPADDRFIWSYRVEIENRSSEVLQLVARYWRITDAAGHVNEVHGKGVVGESPILNPGETFSYTSGAPLPTPSGVMTGRYRMMTSRGEAFEARIPAFSLDSPFDTSRTRPN
jgi:ApaG protein